MYCMKCGEKVPDNASFCPFCGSPVRQLKNPESQIKFVPAICPNCGGTLNVDPDIEKATCKYCGSEFLVSEAAQKYNEIHENYGTIYQGKNVNVTNIDRRRHSILDSLKEREQIKLERERVEAERQKQQSIQDSKDMPWLILFCVICFGSLIIFAFLLR